MLDSPPSPTPGAAPPGGGLAVGGARPGAVLVYGCAFASGLVVMALEILSIRYLTPYFGGDIHTWSGLIATALIALASGYLAGGRLADRWPAARVAGWLLIAAGGWLLLLPMAANPALELVFRGIPDLRVGGIAGALVLLYVPFALMGMFPPYAVRLLLRETVESGTISGRVYAVSTAGGILGILAITFVLIPHLGTQRITVLLGAVVLTGGAALVAHGALGRGGDGAGGAGSGPGGSAAFWLVAGLGAGLTALTGLAWVVAAPRPAITAPGNDPLALTSLPDGLLETRESPYQRIAVHKLGIQMVLSVRSRGSDQIQSIAAIGAPELLLAPYTQLLTLGLLYPERPRRVLALGLGGGAVVEYLAAHMPRLEIDAVELDPEVVSLARAYFGFRLDERKRIAVQDARAYLRTHEGRYDVVLLDVFRGDRVPFHLLTVEFFRLLRERLTPDGVLAVNLVDRSRLPASARRTLRDVFPHLHGYGADGQTVILAHDGPERSPGLLRARAEALQAAHGFRHGLPDLLKRRIGLPPTDDAPLLTDGHAPVEWLQAQPTPAAQLRGTEGARDPVRRLPR